MPPQSQQLLKRKYRRRILGIWNIRLENWALHAGEGLPLPPPDTTTYRITIVQKVLCKSVYVWDLIPKKGSRKSENRKNVTQNKKIKWVTKDEALLFRWLIISILSTNISSCVICVYPLGLRSGVSVLIFLTKNIIARWQKTEVRRQMTEIFEVGIWKSEVGIKWLRNAECGRKIVEGEIRSGELSAWCIEQRADDRV